MPSNAKASYARLIKNVEPLVQTVVDYVNAHGGCRTVEIWPALQITEKKACAALMLARKRKLLFLMRSGTSGGVAGWHSEASYQAAQDELKARHKLRQQATDRARAEGRRKAGETVKQAALAKRLAREAEDDPEFVRQSKRIFRTADQFLPYIGDAANSVWQWRGQVKVSA